MNRLTIIPGDGLVMIDGTGFSGLDMTGIDPDVHAIQWYGSYGEIEYRSRDEAGPDNRAVIVKPSNRTITDLDEFSSVIAAWEAAKSARDNPLETPPPALEDVQAMLDAGLSIWIQAQIATRPDGTPGYASVTSAGNYIGNTICSRWSLEGEKIRDWNTQCWLKALELLNDILPRVAAGMREIPALEEIIAQMPAFEWPVA